MVGARIQYWSCLPPAQSRVAVSEARIDFLTLWAPSDGYVWKDFSQNLRRPIAARWRASSGGWGGRPRLIAEIVPREQQIIARHVDCAGVMDSDLIR